MRILSILGLPNCRRATYTNGHNVRIADFPLNFTDEKITAELEKLENSVSESAVIHKANFPSEKITVPALPRGTEAPRIAVCVTCHADYIPILKRQIDAIEKQTVKPFEKILALDNCSKPEFVPAGWSVITGSFGSPNPLRNAAVAATKAEWIIYADADDIMDEQYLAGATNAAAFAEPYTGIIYADLAYSNCRKIHSPDLFSLDKLRMGNYISACSAWRVKAINEAGGWPNTLCYDDYSLALNIVNLGYTGIKNPVPIRVESHNIAPRRHMGAATGKDFRHKWDQRSFGIVTLLAGREDCLQGWTNWLKNADLPPKTTIYVLDNSGNEKFGKKVKASLASLSCNFMYKAVGKPCDVSKSKWERHQHVAELYNYIIPDVNADWLVMLEDDVIPPLDGLHKLVDSYSFRQHHGGVSGIYQSRANPSCIVGAKGLNFWHDLFKPKDVADGKLHEAGFIAGGFTLWNNGIIQQCKPFRFVLKNGCIPMGWDSNISIDVRNKEHRLFLNGDVQCEHNLKAGE